MNFSFNFSIKTILICLLAAAVLSGCSGRSLSNPEYSALRLANEGSLQHEVDLLAKPLIENEDNIGLVVAVIDKDQEVSIFPYGLKDRKTQQPIKADTLFGLGSTTKSMVVSLLLALDEKGVVSVDETIGNYLPQDMTFADPRIKDITFGQLASHTSGLPREPVRISSLWALWVYFFDGENLYEHLTEEAVYGYLEEFELPEHQSDAPTYSNIGVGLLAHLLTLKTEQSLESLLQSYLFKPLGMTNTVIKLKAEDEARLSTGHAGDQPLFIPWHTPLDNWKFSSVMLGTGGVYSSAQDLVKYLKAHLGQSGTSLDETFKQSRKLLGKDGDHHLTMGWYVDYLEEYDSYLYYYHGMISGFNSYIGFEPKSETAVVVLRNNFNWVDVVGHNLLLRISQAAQVEED